MVSVFMSCSALYVPRVGKITIIIILIVKQLLNALFLAWYYLFKLTNDCTRVGTFIDSTL